MQLRIFYISICSINMYNINVDGGALNKSRTNIYGTHTFSTECINALAHYDKINKYTIYTQTEIETLPDSINIRKIWPNRGWMKIGITTAELQSNKKNNVFLALNQTIPLYTSGPIIGFIHGLSFALYSQLYPDSQKRMHSELSRLIQRARHVVVSSKKVKSELLQTFPKRENIHVIPFGVPTYFIEKDKRYKRKKFILYVGMNHPIKNISLLVHAFKLLIKIPAYSTHKLVLVGVGTAPIDYYGLSRQSIIVIPHAHASLLKKLYNEGACLAVPSLYESFHFPTVEALSQETPVVAHEGAIIPELASFVQTCTNDPKSFCLGLQKCISSTKKINVKSLHSIFSWHTFAKKIMALYHE